MKITRVRIPAWAQATANETAPKTVSVVYGLFVIRIVTGGAVLFFSARSNERDPPFLNWREPAVAERMTWFCR